jgi:hypothetical protein
MAAPDFDFTGNLARQRREEHDAQADDGAVIDRRVREAQAKHPRARVYFDPELDDVVIDLSSGSTR